MAFLTLACEGRHAVTYARFEDMPAWQEAIRFRSQIHCRELLAPGAGLGGLPAEPGDQGPTSSER